MLRERGAANLQKQIGGKAQMALGAAKIPGDKDLS
jgi:hypothetical protein